MPAPRSEHPVCSRQRQRGGILIFTALGMGVLLACLLVLDIANLVWQKREIQKIADLAAVAGANIPINDACSKELNSAAMNNAKSNGLRDGDRILPVHGFWEPKANEKILNFFNSESEVQHNACSIEIWREVSSIIFLKESRNVYARAIAKASLEPTATVLIRSKLLELNGGGVNYLIKALTGSEISLDAVGWNGLANLNVNLLKIFDHLIEVELAAGSYEDLLKTDVSLLQIINAMIVAVEPGNFVQADIDVLNDLLDLNFDDVFVKLGDLVEIDNSTGAHGLNVGLSALEFLKSTLQLATKEQAVNLSLGIGELLQVKMKVIEPAKVAISGNPNGGIDVIEARTAQIRLWLAINLSNIFLENGILNGLTNGLNDLLKWLGLKIPKLGDLDLDLLVDLARGYSKVEEISCSADNKSIRVHVQKALGDIYFGKFQAKSLSDRESIAFGPKLPEMQKLILLGLSAPGCIKCDENYFLKVVFGGRLGLNEIEAERVFVDDEINFFGMPKSVREKRFYYNITPESLAPLSELIKISNILDVEYKSWLIPGLDFGLIEIIDKVLSGILSIFDPISKFLNKVLESLGLGVNNVEIAPYLSCGSSAELVY